jgi:hypothetical protein
MTKLIGHCTQYEVYWGFDCYAMAIKSKRCSFENWFIKESKGLHYIMLIYVTKNAEKNYYEKKQH